MRGSERYMKRSSLFSIAVSKTAFSRALLAALAFSFLAMPWSSAAGCALIRKAPKADKTASAQAEAKPSPAPANDLDQVIAKLNQSAPKFQSAQGDFIFEPY